MKTEKTKTLKILSVFAMILALVMAMSAMGMAFSAWHTEITGSGNATASGKWDIKVTDASLEISDGTTVAKEITELKRTGEKSDSLLASTISSSTWVKDHALMGTQSTEAMSPYVQYYAIDTSKYSLDTIKTYTTSAEMIAMRDDETTIALYEHLNAYYRYVTGENDGTPAAAESSAKAVIDGLIKDTEALLEEMFPETYKNYTIVYISGLHSGSAKAWTKYCYTIASMEKTTVYTTELDGTSAVYNDTTVSYSDVAFALPGAWAKYTLTVTNNGTVNADLSGAEFKLVTDNADQLSLKAPDLSEEVLKAGESCTITLVVEALDNGTDTLEATGNLEIKLPYTQPEVAPAPDAGHTHG